MANGTSILYSHLIERLKENTSVQSSMKFLKFPSIEDTSAQSTSFRLGDSKIPSTLIGRIFCKGRFLLTIIACDQLTTQLRHESCRLNPTYDNYATVAGNTKNVVAF